MSLSKYAGGAYSPWGALAVNMATNKKFHKFVGNVGKAGYRGGKMAYRALSSYKARARPSNARMGRPGGNRSAVLTPGSASHGGTRSFRVRSNRSSKPFRKRGRGTRGGRRKGRRYGGRKGGSGSLMKYLRNMLCTPQINKLTRADAFGGVGIGLRTWNVIPLNSKNNLVDMWNRRPIPVVAAGSGIAKGAPYRAHVHSWMNKFTFQNRSNWDMELKVYEAVVRKSKSFGIAGSASWTSWLLSQFAATDTIAWNQDANQPGYAGGTDGLTAVYQNPAYTPYMSSWFCERMRITKTSSYKIAMNDYVKYSTRCNPIKFDGPDVFGETDAGFQENIAGWTKVLILTWVGGPIDNELLTGAGRQTKAVCDLYYQLDTSYKFWFEPRVGPLYNVTSSNATVNQLGYDTSNRYTTNSAVAGFVVPATSVAQTVVGSDDVPPLHP